MLRTTLAITTILLLALLLYQWPAGPGEEPSDPRPISAKPSKTAVPDRLEEKNSETGPTARPADSALDSPTRSGNRLLEIYGQVSNAQGQPIEGVLITEERYFFSSRTDADGHYRMLLDLPPHRLPQLKFLGAGYASLRVSFDARQIRGQKVIQANVALTESATTLQLKGRISNEFGVGLEGVLVEIRSINRGAEDNFHLTVFSDGQGGFTLEGVPANRHYQLRASLAPDYPIYLDPELYVGNAPNHLDIRLEALQFVTLAGMIVNPDSTPLGGFEIYINNPSTGRRKHKIVSDSSGFFTLPDFPLGAITLSTRGAEFHRISGLQLDRSNYANLEIVIDRGDRYLAGWVSDENGFAISRAMVTVDAVRRDGDVEYRAYRSQTTDEHGRFRFTEIARGEHLISVYAQGFDNLEMPIDLFEQPGQIELRLRPDQNTSSPLPAN